MSSLIRTGHEAFLAQAQGNDSVVRIVTFSGERRLGVVSLIENGTVTILDSKEQESRITIDRIEITEQLDFNGLMHEWD